MQKTSFNSNTVPSSVAQVGITAKYTLLDYVRSRRFFLLLAITAIMGVVMTAVVGYYRPDSLLASPLAFYSNWWTQAIPFVIVLSGIFFGADAISSESQNKTGYFALPNPIKRSSIYIGKWFAAFTAATTIFLIFSAITLGNGLFYFGFSVPSEFLLSLAFSWFYLAAVLGVSFLFSSLFKNNSLSVLVTAITFLFAFNMIELLTQLVVQIEPVFVLTYGAGIINNIFTVPYPAHSITIADAGQTLTMYNVAVPEGLTIIGIYILVTTLIGLLLFERKEFN